MKIRHITWFFLLVLVLGLAALAWFMPARWAVALLAPYLHITQWQQVRGTLWHGHARLLRFGHGPALEQLSWIVPRRLPLGNMQLQGTCQPWGIGFRGRLYRFSGAHMAWRDVRLHADMQRLNGIFPYHDVHLYGRLDAVIAHAQFDGIWPMQLGAMVQWRHARVFHAGRRLALGNFCVKMHARAGVVELELADEGAGALHASGTAGISPLGWHYHVALAPRTDTPALRHYLQTFGPLSVDGRLVLRGRGGLVAGRQP